MFEKYNQQHRVSRGWFSDNHPETKKIEGGNNKPVRVILERPSEKMSQHVKLLYIKAHFDGLHVDRVLFDGGSAMNVMP